MSLLPVINSHDIYLFRLPRQSDLVPRLFNSYTMGCPPVRGDNLRALASGLSYVEVDKHGIISLYHLHQCRPCTSRDMLCLSWLGWYIKLSPCSTKLSLKFQQPIKTKMLKIEDLCVFCFLEFCHFPKCVLIHIRIKSGVCAVKLV